MQTLDAVGWAATALGSTFAVPQLVRLVRTRRTDGLSLLAWQAMLVLNLAFSVHGARIGQAPQLVTSVLALWSSLPLVVLIARHRGLTPWRALAPPLLVACVAVAVDVTVGSAAFGVLVIGPAILANIGYSVELVRAPSVAGVSPAYLVLAVVNQALWVTWALLVPDMGTVVAATTMTALTTFNLGWWAGRRLRGTATRRGTPGRVADPAPSVPEGAA
ncbi:hypothetical protein [Aquipuribacter nitratireducens]|uniref:PQ loop repeat protein n=1 Tax=Aquipuribacter nitratireducens TaxID=650104 RepID=A0ABW0GI59_9MICO